VRRCKKREKGMKEQGGRLSPQKGGNPSFLSRGHGIQGRKKEKGNYLPLLRRKKGGDYVHGRKKIKTSQRRGKNFPSSEEEKKEKEHGRLGPGLKDKGGN